MHVKVVSLSFRICTGQRNTWQNGHSKWLFNSLRQPSQFTSNRKFVSLQQELEHHLPSDTTESSTSADRLDPPNVRFRYQLTTFIFSGLGVEPGIADGLPPDTFRVYHTQTVPKICQICRLYLRSDLHPLHHYSNSKSNPINIATLQPQLLLGYILTTASSLYTLIVSSLRNNGATPAWSLFGHC